MDIVGFAQSEAVIDDSLSTSRVAYAKSLLRPKGFGQRLNHPISLFVSKL
jgi:hypothetical protein